MRLLALSALIVVLSVGTWIGVGYAGCGGQSPSSLVWLNVGGTGTPSSHTQIRCSEAGQNTAKLSLAASYLLAGDACDFTASLHNTGQDGLEISETTTESTGHGDPTFSKCFGFTLSAGPKGGKLAGGASQPYTFTISVLSTATGSCLTSTGTVDLTFTGAPY